MARDRDAIPTGKVRRTAGATAALGPSTLKLAGSLVTSIARDPESAHELLERRHEELADHALGVLANLRGGAMKIGQLASFVDVEFLPPEFRTVWQDRLASLRDAAPPMPWKKVRAVLEQEWDEPVESIFEDLEEEAVAAASIGQVHRGVLPDGRRVAVKVQYPEIADALASDVGLAGLLIPLGKALMPGFEPKLIVGELRERILEELDYELEAQHQRAFARVYRRHPFIHVPAVMTELSRRRVLVSEWVEGAGFDEMVGLPQEERNRIGEIIQRFFFGAMYRVGRFNTDAHPGNYLLREDGSMAFLDFGSVKLVDPDYLKVTIAAIKAMLDGDRDRFMETLTDLGYVHRGEKIDVDLVLEQSLAGGDWFLRDEEIEVTPDYVARLIAPLSNPRMVADGLRMARHLKVPPEAIWLRRVDVGVLAVLGHLRARGNWHRCARELWFGDPPATELGRQEREYFGPWAGVLPA
jgi:predicted unusual protein kinase regulating ubiquinone biosynthesis (AarF/ABC1/UbiB family)